MKADLRSRSQCLTLALFTQRTIRELLNFIETGNRDTLRPALSDALTSLEDVRRGELPQFTQRRPALFASYEHLRTLEEVWSRDEQDAAVSDLHNLLQEDPTSPDAQASAHRLIDLLTKLGNRARWNFEQRSITPPHRLRELCQVQ
jgi:hypothetical protein